MIKKIISAWVSVLEKNFLKNVWLWKPFSFTSVHKNDSSRGLPYQNTVHQALQIMQIHVDGLMKNWPPHSESVLALALWWKEERKVFKWFCIMLWLLFHFWARLTLKQSQKTVNLFSVSVCLLTQQHLSPSSVTHHRLQVMFMSQFSESDIVCKREND